MPVGSDMQMPRMISCYISYCPGEWRCGTLLQRKGTEARIEFPTLSGFG